MLRMTLSFALTLALFAAPAQATAYRPLGDSPAASLGTGGGGTHPGRPGQPGDSSIRNIIQDLYISRRYLQNRDEYNARRPYAEMIRWLSRHPRYEVRRVADTIHAADQAAYQRRFRSAIGYVDRAISTLRRYAGGGGQPSDPDYHNRAEWRRGIRRVVDVLRHGDLWAARQRLEGLARDIRRDGHDWNRNRGYVQRLQYVHQGLRPGNTGWAIQELQALARQMSF